MTADRLGISLHDVEFWLTPWVRKEEHMSMSHLAEITHTRGLVWDKITVESSGGVTPLTISGLPKGPARNFVVQVRERLHKQPVTPPAPPPSPR
jgi:hypothetical protein